MNIPKRDRLRNILAEYTQQGYESVIIKEELKVTSEVPDEYKAHIYSHNYKEKILDSKIMILQTSVLFQNKVIYKRYDSQPIPFDVLKKRIDTAKEPIDIFNKAFAMTLYESIEKHFIMSGLMSHLHAENQRIKERENAGQNIYG